MRVSHKLFKYFLVFSTLLMAYSLFFVIRYYPKKNQIKLDEIYVINLDRSHERYTTIKDNLDSVGLPHTRFSAVDGYNVGIIDENGKKFTGMDLKLGNYRIDTEKPFKILCPTISLTHDPKTDNRYSLSAGEYGCYCSHLEVLKDIVQKKLNYALILEDDAYFSENAPQNLNKILEHAPKDFDILYLFCLTSKKRTKVFNNFINEIIPAKKGLASNAAYIVSAKGAKKLLETLTIPSIPIDLVISNLVNQSEIKAYVTSKKFVQAQYIRDFGKSLIHEMGHH